MINLVMAQFWIFLLVMQNILSIRGLPKHDCQCGLEDSNNQNHLTWLVGLYLKKSPDSEEEFFCNGVFVSQWHILTTQTCDNFSTYATLFKVISKWN